MTALHGWKPKEMKGLEWANYLEDCPEEYEKVKAQARTRKEHWEVPGARMTATGKGYARLLREVLR